VGELGNYDNEMRQVEEMILEMDKIPDSVKHEMKVQLDLLIKCEVSIKRAKDKRYKQGWKQ